MARQAGDVKVRITGNTDAFKAALKSAQKSISNFSDKASRGMKSVKASLMSVTNIARGLVAALAAREIVQGASQIITSLDGIGKAAKAAGIGAEDLQAYQYALGQIAGIGKEQVSEMFVEFNKRMGEAIMGTGESKAAFEELGVSLEQSTGSALEEALNKIANMTDRQKAAALASKLFGDQAKQLAGNLAGQGEAMDDLTQYARENIVASDEQVRRAEKLNDFFNTTLSVALKEITDLLFENSDAVVALGKGFGIAVSAITEVISFLISHVRKGWDIINKNFVQPLAKEFAPQIEATVNYISRMGQAFKLLYDVSITVFTGIVKTITSLISGTVERLKSFGNLLVGVFTLDVEKIKEGLRGSFKATSDTFDEIVSNAKETLSTIGEMFDDYANNRVSANEKIVASDDAATKEQADNAEELRRLELERIKADRARAEAQALVNSVMEKSKTSQELYTAAVVEFVSAAQLMELSQEEIAKGVDTLAKKFGMLKEKIEETKDPTEDLVSQLGTELSNAIRNSSLELDNFRGMIDNVLNSMLQMVVQESILNPLSIKAKAGLGGLVGGIRSIVGLAGGGPMNAGQPYIVGEKGPELIVPGSNALVLNNMRSRSVMGGAGGGNVSIEFVNRGTPQQPVDIQQTVSPEGLIVQVITEDARRGGQISRTIQSVARRR